MPFAPILLEADNPGAMTGRGNNTFLIPSSGEAALVDAGIGDPVYMTKLADALARSGSRLTRVLVTHGHADHASGAPALCRAHPAVRLHKYPWPDEDARYHVPWEPLRDGEEVVIGSERLTVLHTPGHSPDHLAFWHEPSRTAFAGDLVVAGSSVMIHWSRGGDLGEYLGSLERLLALQPAHLLPAHGPAVAAPEALLRNYIAHRKMRERQVLEAVEAGLETVPRITEFIYHGLDPALLPAARENVRAHLEKLTREGRVSAGPAAGDEGPTWTRSSTSSTSTAIDTSKS